MFLRCHKYSFSYCFEYCKLQTNKKPDACYFGMVTLWANKNLCVCMFPNEQNEFVLNFMADIDPCWNQTLFPIKEGIFEAICLLNDLQICNTVLLSMRPKLQQCKMPTEKSQTHSVGFQALLRNR
ncbi:unnamed protein product [Lepidochelys kempii]